MGKGTEAAALRFACAKCGARAGEACKNYRGVNCAPHSGREPSLHAEAKRRLLPALEAPEPVQRSLFDIGTHAQREGGL